MKEEESNLNVDKWARFRFSLIGGLLSSPPEKGELKKALRELSCKLWKHPTNDELIKISFSSLERWYYRALNQDDPISCLRRKIREDAGTSRVMNCRLLCKLSDQYKVHPSWSYQLHADNLTAAAEKNPDLGKAPSYSTVRREMQQSGWYPQKVRPRKATAGQKAALERLETREQRGYESYYVNGLWHSDYHQCSRRVVDTSGEWRDAFLFCVMDDRSRVCCHVQWYLHESSETFYHGLSQAFFKRGLPRALMTDNGKAMTSTESVNGLEALGINHKKTLPYSPYQNGKQESFWGAVEGRLMKMLENVEPLTLDFLNLSTQAWVEMEYNQKVHSELDDTPINVMLEGPSVQRPSPESERIRLAFSRQSSRVQRRSDGTITISGVRFELPSRFRTMRRLTVRHQNWDLSRAAVVDARRGTVLAHIFPQNKTRNADGRRRLISPESDPKSTEEKTVESDPVPELLRKYLEEYSATGLPPAYITKDDSESKNVTENKNVEEKKNE